MRFVIQLLDVLFLSLAFYYRACEISYVLKSHTASSTAHIACQKRRKFIRYLHKVSKALSNDN